VALAADYFFTADGFEREKKKTLEAVGQSENGAGHPSNSESPLT